jgi:hypothetical protein
MAQKVVITVQHTRAAALNPQCTHGMIFNVYVTHKICAKDATICWIIVIKTYTINDHANVPFLPRLTQMRMNFNKILLKTTFFHYYNNYKLQAVQKQNEAFPVMVTQLPSRYLGARDGYYG